MTLSLLYRLFRDKGTNLHISSRNSSEDPAFQENEEEEVEEQEEGESMFEEREQVGEHGKHYFHLNKVDAYTYTFTILHRVSFYFDASNNAEESLFMASPLTSGWFMIFGYETN